MSKRELIKSELKISKNAQKAVALLDDLETLLEKYSKLLDKINTEERVLLGGIIVATHSPLQKVAYTQLIGHPTVLTGLIGGLKRRIKNLVEGEGVLDALSAMGNMLPDPPELKGEIDKIKK